MTRVCGRKEIKRGCDGEARKSKNEVEVEREIKSDEGR